MTLRELIKGYISLSNTDTKVFKELMNAVDGVAVVKITTPKPRRKSVQKITGRHRIECKRCGRVTLKSKKTAIYCGPSCSDSAWRERTGKKVSSNAPKPTVAWTKLLAGDSLRAGK